MAQLESDFKKIFLDLIKPFYLVIGDKSLKVSKKFLNEYAKKHSEILTIVIDDFLVEFMFKQGVPYSKRKCLFVKAVNGLICEFETLVGVAAERMINYSLKKFIKKYCLKV